MLCLSVLRCDVDFSRISLQLGFSRHNRLRDICPVVERTTVPRGVENFFPIVVSFSLGKEQKLQWAWEGGVQRSVLRINEPKKTGARSARIATKTHKYLIMCWVGISVHASLRPGDTSQSNSYENK
jgi:hypothetical protein